MIPALSLLGTTVVLASYAASAVRNDPRIFHWGNVAGAPILFSTGVCLAAYGHATLSLAFGLVAGAALRKGGVS